MKHQLMRTKFSYFFLIFCAHLSFSQADIVEENIEIYEGITGDKYSYIVEGEKVLREFLAAQNAESALPFVTPDENLKKDFKFWTPKPEVKDIEYRFVTHLDLFKRLYFAYSVTFKDYSSRLHYVQYTGKDTITIDWRKTSLVEEYPIPYFRDNKSKIETARLRGILEQASYYNFGYKEEQWFNFSLKDFEGNKAYFYVERGSKLADEMKTMINYYKRANENDTGVLALPVISLVKKNNAFVLSEIHSVSW